MTERTDPPLSGDEWTLLTTFLDFHRQTLAQKTAGLDTEQLDRALAPSTMTLGGMLKHLAYVEDYWCGEVLLGATPGAPWDAVDWRADPDWDWHSAAADTPEQLRTLWQDTVARSERVVAELGPDLDRAAANAHHDGTPNLRYVLIHLIEEYARHNGHADLIRESIDGSVGE